MKKILSVILFFVATVTILACFVADPNANLGDFQVMTSCGNNGAATVTVPKLKKLDITTEEYTYFKDNYQYKITLTNNNNLVTRVTQRRTLPNGEYSTVKTLNYNALTHGVWNDTLYEINALVSCPFTYQLEFHGFEGHENEPVTRLCFLYLDKSGKWKILKDIRNPQFTVTSNDGVSKAMFGKYSVQSTFGYKTTEILFLLAYFETANRSSHNLNTLLNTTYQDPTTVDGAVRLSVITNKNPL